MQHSITYLPCQLPALRPDSIMRSGI